MGKTSAHQLQVQVIRSVLNGFIKERLQVKLKYLGPDQVKKREMLVESHRLDAWLANAANRASQIRLASHTLKPIYPDAQGTNLYVTAVRETPGLVGTHSLKGLRPVDAVGSPRAWDIARLLTKVECNGRLILQWVLANDPSLLEALSSDPVRAQSMCSSLAKVVETKPIHPTSHQMAKQVFFPLPNGGYHLLAPLFPTTLVHRMHQIIHECYFGTASVAAREAHRDNRPWSRGYSNYPDLAVRRLGGKNPQNISLLNGERCGENWLLPSLPPGAIGAPSPKDAFSSGSIFDQALAQKEPIRTLIAEFQRLLHVHPFSSSKFRLVRKQLVREIGEEVIQYAARLQTRPSGWSADLPRRLNEWEEAWLDPRPTIVSLPSSNHKTVWPAEVTKRFADWLAEFINSKPSRFARSMGSVSVKSLHQDLRFFTEFISNGYD